jgi:hypothetical protein
MCPTGREPSKHIRDSDPHVSDARTATALTWLDCNDVLVIHGYHLASFSRERSGVCPSHVNDRNTILTLTLPAMEHAP